MVSELITFGEALMRHEIALLAGIIGLAIGIWERVKGRAIASEIFWAISLLSLLVASFFAWDDQFKVVEALTSYGELGIESTSMVDYPNNKALMIQIAVKNFSNATFIQSLSGNIELDCIVGTNLLSSKKMSKNPMSVAPTQMRVLDLNIVDNSTYGLIKAIINGKQDTSILIDATFAYETGEKEHTLESTIMYEPVFERFVTKSEKRTSTSKH
jgi:regulator of extracellular matrix RemA (YlzA/DUF370 family)